MGTKHCPIYLRTGGMKIEETAAMTEVWPVEVGDALLADTSDSVSEQAVPETENSSEGETSPEGGDESTLPGPGHGMSTVPEAIAASHMGIRVAAMSCITNMAAGITGQALSEQEVLDNAALASENSCAVVKEFIRRINL